MNVRNLVSVLFLTSHFFYFYIASTYEVVHTLKTACKFVPAVKLGRLAVRWLEWNLWEDGRYILS